MKTDRLRYLIPDFPPLAFLRNLGPLRTKFIALTITGWASKALRFYTVVLLGELVSTLTNLSVADVLNHYMPLWALCVFLSEALDYLARRYGETLAQKVADVTQEQLTLLALEAPLARLRSLSRERLLSSLRTYTAHVERFGNEWCWMLISQSFSAFAVMVVLFIQNPIVLLLNLAFVVLFLAVALHISSQIAPFVANHTSSRLQVGERQTSFVLGLPFLKRFGAEVYYKKAMRLRYHESWQALDDLKKFHAWRWLLQLSLFDIMTIGTIGYGAYQVADKQLNVGFLVLLKWSFDQLFFVLVYIIEGYVAFINGREDAKLLREQFAALDLEREVVATIKESAGGESLLNQEPISWHECQLRDVVIVYPGKGASPKNGGSDDQSGQKQGGESPSAPRDPRPAAEGVDLSKCRSDGSNGECAQKEIRIPAFTLRRGEIVGVVGESGAGKTSFVEALGRFPQFLGSYLIDGTNFPYGQESPLTSIMITPHDPLFKASIRENISLGSRLSDSQILETLAIVEATSFCSSLDAIISDGSLAFSSGQEQRLRLARALLSSADMLLLDEPLTGIDDDTRAKILQALKEKLHGRTVVLVTHHPDELALAHRVVRVTNGVLVGE